MNVLGFYLGKHDSNITIVHDGKATYFKSERLTQIKHHKADLKWINDICEKNSFKPDLVCFSDGNRNGLGVCNIGELFQESTKMFGAKTFCIDHHYAHILSAWMLGNATSAKYGICIDGRGDNNTRISIIENPFQIEHSKIIKSSCNYQYCMFFQELGKYMGLSGLSWDYAGKIMGLQAYGNINSKLVGMYYTKDFMQHPLALLKKTYHQIPINELFIKNESLFKDWLASIHFLIQKFIVEIFTTNFKSDDIIVYSGGCAQNTVINTNLNSIFSNLLIPPHCYDGGISLGCAYFAAKYINEEININEFPFCNGMDDLGYASEKTINQVADLLAKGKIVGWAQGKSEIGPRALGHRSILANPTIDGMKNVLNFRVKKREYWRPFAASVLLENLNYFTDSMNEYPYMLHAVNILKKLNNNYESIIHCDNTCRFQTVDYSKPLLTYRTLLNIMQKEYNINALLNTSLNINGKPIALTHHNCLENYNYSSIDAICIGNNLLVK